MSGAVANVVAASAIACRLGAPPSSLWGESFWKGYTVAEKDALYVGPLYSPGVHHAEVHSPTAGSPPDPLGLLDANRPSLSWTTQGGGDNVNDWKALPPSDGKS